MGDKELSSSFHKGKWKVAAISVAILVSVHLTKLIFELGQEIDKNNAYIPYEI